MNVFAKNLKKHIKGSGKTVAQIASDFDLTVRTLNNYMAGTRTPRPDQFERIADYFGVSLDSLLAGRDAAYKGPPQINLNIDSPDLEKALALVEHGLTEHGQIIPPNKKAALVIAVLKYLAENPKTYTDATIKNMVRLAV